MIRDVWAVMRKEWKELFLPGGSLWGGAWSEALIVVGALGVFIALQVGRAWVSSEVALFWMWLPLLQMTGTIAESIAGERERRTLETLLASRLSDRAILFGKVGAAIGYGWGLTLLCLLVGLVTVNLTHGRGELLLYPPDTALGLLVLSLLGAGLVAGAGVLISLRAPTVRQAYQRLSIALLLAFLPIFSTQFLPAEWQVPLLPRGGPPTDVPTRALVMLAIVLAALDIGLFAAALRQFRRSRLILD